jgi:hypothetical protein
MGSNSTILEVLEDKHDDQCMQTEQIELLFLVFFRPHMQIGRVLCLL